MELLLGQVETVRFLVRHAEMIVIGGIVGVGLDGLLEQVDCGIVNALLVVRPAQGVGGVR